MSNILNQLDGLASGEGVLVMATSNAPEKLDPALVHRPSRFDRIWRFGLPGEEQRLAQIKGQYKNTWAREGLGKADDDSPTLGFTMEPKKSEAVF
ncbi:MAG: ATP-binding protein [Elusimicrobiota bacterium]|nr:ATP-binding protein [Elusimicrobiota bacterium]